METVTKTDPPILKHGQGVRALVEARRHELELELAEIKKGAPGNSADIDAALSALTALLTGNLDQIPPVLAQELSQWIETSKFLGTTQAVTKPRGTTVPITAPELRALIEERHRQHEVELSDAKKRAPEKVSEVETALTSLKALLAGHLDEIPPNVAEELAELIEKSKLLGTKASRTQA